MERQLLAGIEVELVLAYAELNVALHVGGRRYPVDPMSTAAFPDGPGLSLESLRLAVERLRALRVAGERPLAAKLGLWAAPDPFEHTDPAEAWSLLRQAEIGEEEFHATGESRLIPTDAARLGTDSDWHRTLDDLLRVGVRHVWFTFLGLEGTHDALVGRKGAFAAIVAAMERCAAVGLQIGANVVVSTRNLGEIGELARHIRALGAERFVPAYVQGWSQLGAEYESIRPTAEDLRGLPPEGLDVNWGYNEFWSNPRGFTEGALTRAVLESDGDEPKESNKRVLPLFVDANLDLFVGSLVTPPVQRVANLLDESPATVYRALVNLNWPPAPPSDADLAQKYGDPNAEQVHMGRFSVRRKWLSAWRFDEQVAWLP